MAILHGHIDAAHSAFKISIQIAIDEKLDQIIDFIGAGAGIEPARSMIEGF
jgi:hypothetical protein